MEYWKHLGMKVSCLIQSHQHLILLKSPTTLKMNGRLLLYLTIHLPLNFTVFKSVPLKNRNYAYELNSQLTEEGFPAFILMDGDLYKVQVGAFSRLENAIRMEYRLRAAGYDTYITT